MDRKKAKANKPKTWAGVMRRFPLALAYVSKLSQYGAFKYGVKVGEIAEHVLEDKYEGLSEGVARHLLAETEPGQHNEEDGGMLHAGNLAWNALARLQVYLEQNPSEMDWNPAEAWDKVQKREEGNARLNPYR